MWCERVKLGWKGEELGEEAVLGMDLVSNDVYWILFSLPSFPPRTCTS